MPGRVTEEFRTPVHTTTVGRSSGSTFIQSAVTSESPEKACTSGTEFHALGRMLAAKYSRSSWASESQCWYDATETMPSSLFPSAGGLQWSRPSLHVS
eukprot:4099751-Amphidinium_carterae.2